MTDLRAAARAAAMRHGLPPGAFERQIGAESNFDPNAVSPKGARGIAQLMAGSTGDPIKDLDIAARMMAGYVRRFGSYEKALRAYNAGPNAVDRSYNYAETNAYVRKILGSGDFASSAGLPGKANVVTQAKVTPAREVPDKQAAIVQALATAPARLPKLGSSGALGRAAYLLSTGQATKTVPTGFDPATIRTVADHARTISGKLTPTGAPGKIIGTPYTGTHTLGNWQSDNAVDIRVPEGTPMIALQDGVVLRVRHHPQDGGRFAGDQITVRGANGNIYFYAHGRASVKPGQRVRRGQRLGTTGSANGVPHLHFGQERGDPREHTR